MSYFKFDAFCGYDFARSQAPASKYRLAGVWLEPPERLAGIRPFPDFDIRHTSPRALTAYWINFALRLRIEGLTIAVPLLDALKDGASHRMLRVLLSCPPSAREFRLRLKPFREQVLREEAARLAFIRKAALAVFRKGDVLAGLGDEERADAIARGEAIWQQETAPRSEPGGPSPAFRVPMGANRVELAAVFHFLARLFAEDGMMHVETYVGWWRGDAEASPYADAFLDYALNQAAHNYRPAAAICANIMQREKTLRRDLAIRLDALTAYFIDLLQQDSSPEHLLSRLNSFWPEDAFADTHALRRHLGEGEKA